MPLLKSDAPPIPPEEVEAIRARLAEPYDHEVVERDERRFLFLRSATETPDPVADLEAGFEIVPVWVVKGLSDVFLLGRRADLHIPGSIARPVFDRRTQLDAVLARETTETVDVHYGLRIHRTAADPHGATRLLARVPRAHCTELQEADLLELARRVGPLHESGQLRGVRTVHLVAEGDHVRFRARDFLGDLLDRFRLMRESEEAARFEAAKRSQQEAFQAQRAADEAERQRIAALPPPPKPVVDITPAFELEVQVDALPAAAAGWHTTEDAETSFANHLVELGYEIARAPFLPDSPFTLEARRSSLYPHKLGLLVRGRFDRPEADEAVRLVRERGLDLLLVASPEPNPEALKRVAASRVQVLRPADLRTFTP